MKHYSALMLLIFLTSFQALAQKRLPIVDMHLHARHADYTGLNS